jgi:cobalamin biosynthesis protein CobD/CbiB
MSDREAWMYGQTLKDAQLSAVLSGKQLHDVKQTIAALIQMGLDQERATVFAVVYADVLMERLSGTDQPPLNRTKDTTKAANGHLLAGAMLALLCILVLTISKVPLSSTAVPTAPLMTALFTFPTIPDSMLIEVFLSSSST